MWLRDIVTVVAQDGEPRWLRGLMVDVSAQKLAEQELRIAAVAFESQEGMLVTDCDLQISVATAPLAGLPAIAPRRCWGSSRASCSRAPRCAVLCAQMWQSINSLGVGRRDLEPAQKWRDLPGVPGLERRAQQRRRQPLRCHAFSDITLRKAAMDESTGWRSTTC